MNTKKEALLQVKYILDNKEEYLANGTTKQELNDRIMMLKNPDYNYYKLFVKNWNARHGISPAPSITSWRANYKITNL